MKIIAICSLIVLSGIFIALSVCAPHILSKNAFLVGFVNHEMLNILAVIMTIAIASIAIIHIWFNELEDKHGKKVFGGARKEINQAAYYFIGLFVAALTLLITKSLPIFAANVIAESLFNGAAVILVLCSVITLMDVMGVVRALTPTDD